jgi:hypothetical protein
MRCEGDNQPEIDDGQPVAHDTPPPRPAKVASDDAADPGYAQGEFGMKPGEKRPARATAVERAASKPGAAQEAAPLPETPRGGDPSTNPRPGSGG